MLFTSYNFIAAIAVLFVVYYLLPRKYQWKLLLIASYLFYWMSGHIWVIYIGVTTLVTWLMAVQIGNLAGERDELLKEHTKTLEKEEKKRYRRGIKKKQKKYFFIALSVDIGLLAVMKYTNFVISNINGILNGIAGQEPLSFLKLALPMGISFYTFQAVGYLIDVYREKYAPEKNLGKFALFVSFFPQLIQGPISRYDDLSKSLYEEHKFESKNVAYGLQRILWGYFKKLVIADRILVAVKVLTQAPENYQGIFVFAGMLFYAVELYADFTGGIDITIGIAEVMGIRVKENFCRPFFSKNIKEYWNRWHISMGSWFTDYIFYPVSVSGGMLRISQFSREHLGKIWGKRVPVYFSAFIVWFTTGIWHGASWNFIVWGLANCVVILVSQEMIPLYRKFHGKFEVSDKSWYRAFQIIRTVLLLSCLRLFDCYRDVPMTFRMFGSMFTKWSFTPLLDGSFMRLGLDGWDYLILIFGILLMFAVSMIQRRKKVRDWVQKKPYALRFCIWYGLFIVVLLTGAYGQGYDAGQFIYNQF